MALITYIEPSGQSVSVEVADGWSLMQGATAGGVDGILGECGGSCACATCHCYVDEKWLDKLAPMDDLEDGMLDGAKERRPNSRLSCQIQISDALDGIVLEEAENNM